MPEIKGKTKIFINNNYKYFLCVLSLILTSTLAANSMELRLNPAEINSTEVLAGLVLNGIILSEDKHSSVALLKDNRNGEDLTLKNGETFEKFNLVQILENRIVFQRSEETYQLFLGRSGIFNAIQKEGTKSKNDMEIKSEEAERQTPEESEVTKEFSRSYIEKRILAEWKMILDQIQISPHIVAGQTKGFKLIKIPEGSLLSEIGLQRNDIILRLNGEELKDKAFIISLIDQFKNDDRGTMTIERDGKVIRYLLFLK